MVQGGERQTGKRFREGDELRWWAHLGNEWGRWPSELKAAATHLDVQALRVTFALEAEEWFVEQFKELNHGKAFLEKFLGRPLESQLLTNEERERLTVHLREVRKVRNPGGASMDRVDGKPRNAFGQPREVVSPTKPGPMIRTPRGPRPGPGR